MAQSRSTVRTPLLYRAAWLVVPLLLGGCGGSGTPSVTVSIACGGHTELYGAASVDVLGEMQNGRVTLAYPDPVNPGKTGTIAVPPGERCTITPAVSSK